MTGAGTGTGAGMLSGRRGEAGTGAGRYRCRYAVWQARRGRRDEAGEAGVGGQAGRCLLCLLFL